ncbi:MAG: transporter substrate-binding domain-containing protein, partial [Bacteroidota bacterium]
PYLHNQLILVGRKGADVSARTFEELSGSKLGVVGSYAYGDEMNNLEGLEVVSGSSDQQNLERLIAEEVDYILVDALLVEYLLIYQSEEAKDYLAIGQWPLLNKSLHLGIRKNVADAESIITRFNKEVIRMMVDGTFNKVLELNYIRADVDGDGKLEMIMSGNRAGKRAPTSSYNVFSTSSQPTAFGNHSYYIDGKKYNSWDEVPGQYKTPMSTEEASKFTILNFGIKK